MRICFFGIYDPTYSRNAILLAGLRELGVEVIECREDWRDPRRYRKLWRSLRALEGQYDLIYAAYPSPVPVILARMVSWKPVVADAFYSMFDSVVNDRRKFSPWSLRAIRLLILDWLGVMLAHRVIVDTQQHKNYWSRWLGMSAAKISTVYLGINDRVFTPAPMKKKDHILVHFQGTYIPLQGACAIVEAINLCPKNLGLKFRMIGNGRDFPKAKALADKYSLDIEFIGQVPLADLNSYLAEADIVLGIFGDREKTLRVIPNKVYEGLAAERALITMDTPAIREIFSDEDMSLVGNDPQSIADGIVRLAKDEPLRVSLAKHGYDTVCRYKPASVARSLLTALADISSTAPKKSSENN